MRTSSRCACIAVAVVVLLTAAHPALGAPVQPSLLVGFADDLFTSERSGGVGVRGTLLRSLSRTWDVGLEGGWYDLGGYHYTSISGPPGDQDTTRFENTRQAWHASGVLRVHTARSRLRPAAFAGLGVYGDRRTERQEPAGPSTTRTDLRPGFDVGVGLEYGPLGHRLSLALEAAWHFRVVVLDDAAGVEGIACTILLGVRRR